MAKARQKRMGAERKEKKKKQKKKWRKRKEKVFKRSKLKSFSEGLKSWLRIFENMLH